MLVIVICLDAHVCTHIHTDILIYMCCNVCLLLGRCSDTVGGTETNGGIVMNVHFQTKLLNMEN